MAGDEPTVGRWTVDALVLEVPPRPPIACRTLLTSLPPAAGSGVEVRGMDLRSVPGTTVYDNGTMLTPTVRLTGTYDGRRLTLTERAVPVPAPVHAAIAYAQPDLGVLWFSEAARVLNVSFTGNVDRHRQALRAVFPGPLCVVPARVAKAELNAVQRRLHADRNFHQQHWIQVLGSSQTIESLHILVAAARPAQIRLLQNRYGPTVKVTSWLQPAQPDQHVTKNIIDVGE
jgi:hypothetical protein